MANMEIVKAPAKRPKTTPVDPWLPQSRLRLATNPLNAQDLR
jgi:hypothetical protein